MKIWKAIILVVVVVVLGSSYDFWRGYHEWHSIGTGFLYSILGWVVFGAIAGILYLFKRSG